MRPCGPGLQPPCLNEARGLALKARTLAATSTSRRRIHRALFVATAAWSKAAAQEILLLAHEDEKQSSRYGATPKMATRKVAPKSPAEEAPLLKAAQAARWARRQLDELVKDSAWV